MAIFSSVISSCFPCENIACDYIPPYGHFTVVNVAWQDLVFGPNKIYNKNQFKFYSLSGSDTTFFEYRIVETKDPIFESALRVLFDPLPEVAYMRLSDGDIDTLNISYTSTETNCCGTLTEITHFRHNDSDAIPADTWIQVLLK